MKDQARGRQARAERHEKGLQHQLSVDALAHPPAHDFAGIQVQDDRQEQPALRGEDVGDVGDPHRVENFGFTTYGYFER